MYLVIFVSIATAQNEALMNTSLQQIYVRKTGNDITGDGTSSKPLLTIAKANSMLMSNFRTKEVIIDGDYSDEHLVISNIAGIAVRVRGVNEAKVKSIFFSGYRAAHLYFSDLIVTESTTASGYESCIASPHQYASPDSYIVIDNCKVLGVNTTVNGVFINGNNNVVVNNCTIDNSLAAININVGILVSKNNAGTGNIKSLNSAYKAYIKTIGTQPDGVTSINNGGIIE